MGIDLRISPYYFYISDLVFELTVPKGFIMRQLRLTVLFSAGKRICGNLLTAPLFLMLFFIGCSKRDVQVEDNGTAINRTELLTTGEWKLNAWTWTINPAEMAAFDEESESDAVSGQSYENDEVALFKASGEVVMDVVMNPKTFYGENTAAGRATDKWEWTSDHSGIVIGTGEEATTYMITELTANRLKMRQTYVDDGTTYVSEMTLIH
ncbi:hypothetical protein [Niabella hirudinis]|uniref:hypothetical protein n=1 Tax=Niabella hirudinis TaxID=1285929 RepID=UPI003EC0B6DB